MKGEEGDKGVRIINEKRGRGYRSGGGMRKQPINNLHYTKRRRKELKIILWTQLDQIIFVSQIGKTNFSFLVP